jgi:3-methyladenine DNA glycosylase AlkD
MSTTNSAITALTADQFVKRLKTLRSSKAAKALAHLASDEDDVVMGVRMGQVFALAKEFMNLPLDQVEKLLESPIHEVRVGAVSIMDFQARSKRTSASRRKELFDLYIRRHDRINTWDLVDRSAPYVVGGYLFDKPRQILYRLARSKAMPERRTAIVSTGYFIRQRDVDDTFKIAAWLLDDDDVADLLFAARERIDFYWTFYVLVTTAVIGWLLSLKKPLTVSQKALVSVAYSIAAIMNFVGLYSAYSLAEALRTDVLRMAANAPLVDTRLMLEQHSYLSQQVAAFWIHLVLGAAVLLVVWRDQFAKSEPAQAIAPVADDECQTGPGNSIDPARPARCLAIPWWGFIRMTLWVITSITFRNGWNAQVKLKPSRTIERLNSVMDEMGKTYC